jgi:fluoroacetyl-CoA thioesterase
MENFEKIQPGMTSEQLITIEEKHATFHLSKPVLSTPMMIDMMETVCEQLIHSLTPSEFTSVGYEVNIKHKAPAFLGSQVKVWCEVQEVAGRKILLKVRVTQEDKVIGEGLHRRTIVPNA